MLQNALVSGATVGFVPVALLTGNWLSPIAGFADVVIPRRVDAPSPFDSLVPAMEVTEAVVAAVTETLANRGKTRLEKVESALEIPDR
ncbi:hypothetical protein AB0M34_33290 [Nocardia sp. NPDC050193]